MSDDGSDHMRIKEEMSPYWRAIFDDPPIEIKDTESFEYVRYLELGTNSNINYNLNPPAQFKFENKDIATYLFMSHSIMHIQGSIYGQRTVYTNVANGPSTPGALGALAYVPGGVSCALVNLGQFALFSYATLYIDNKLIETNANPSKIALIRAMISMSPSAEKSQGSLNFFYKDTNGYCSTQKIAGGADNTSPIYDADVESTSYCLGYNEGYTKRYRRCISQIAGATQRVIDLYLPLNQLFNFYDACRLPFIGTRHTITLTRNTNVGEYFMADGTSAVNSGFCTPNLANNIATGTVYSNPQFVYKTIDWWVPALVPSVSVDTYLLEKMEHKAEMSLKWYEMQISQLSGQTATMGKATATHWRIDSIGHRLNKVYVMFQSEDRGVNINANAQLFDHACVQSIKVRLGANIFTPLEPWNLTFDTSNGQYYLPGDTDDYKRAYRNFLEAQGKILDDTDGLLISEEEFKSLYPIYVFDMSKVTPSIFEKQSTVEVSVDFQLSANFAGLPAYNGIATPVTTYRVYAILEVEKEAMVRADGRSLQILL